jgi:hypothetical protein
MKYVRTAGEILLGIGTLLISVAGVTLTVKICWAVVEFTWKLW